MPISNSAEFFAALKRRPHTFYIIHYSCESLYDDNTGLSPRITSIAVKHYSSGQTVSFSAHIVAEQLGIAREQIHEQYDEVEARLLKDFFSFARERKGDTWVHWNMDNIAYGFEHIEHRYECLLKETPPVVPVEQRVNLSWMISDRYGTDYAPHPKMLKLMEQNGERDRHFLTGLEEIDAFKKHEFIRMHMSVLAKVNFFRDVMDKASRGKLKTTSNSLLYHADQLLEGRGARFISLAGNAASVGVVIWQVASILL